jgi:dolichyl-phosphate-mannose--protein O-mannosyl transferase|tara:strand:- start:260 stop:529 length:270 start_codon:yes stop_codon:yes gene_type:complete
MKEFLFFMANFLDFWFLPFIIMFIVSIIIEQVIRRQDDEKKIETAMRVRKFLWRQNILLNFSWFLCYFILMFMLRSTPQAPMPDMIWQG